LPVRQKIREANLATYDSKSFHESVHLTKSKRGIHQILRLISNGLT